MAYNKVEANGETLIDLTSDTVTADTLVSGRTAHLASGERVAGTFEPVTGVKGNAESTYRKGDVNLTPANIGAATTAQGTKADNAIQTVQVNGTAQTKTNNTVNISLDKSSVGLENVDNTSDLDKPISTATQAALDSQQGKIDNAIKRNENNNVNYIMFNNITIPFANNAGFHNSIYRGKGLGTSYTAAQKAQVKASTFDDLFVGDYWLINNIHWRIAHCNYYLNTGDTATTAPHLVIVPDESLASSYMNATDVTTGAYVGSYMYTTTLLQDGTEASDSVFGKIKAAFGEENLLSMRQLFANGVDSNGNVSGWAWYTTRCFLMNQCMVYGQKALANGNNDGYNVGIDKTQLALFAHDTSTINRRYTYSLRDVRSSTFFACVAYDGAAANYYASIVLGVRPVFLLS